MELDPPKRATVVVELVAIEVGDADKFCQKIPLSTPFCWLGENLRAAPRKGVEAFPSTIRRRFSPHRFSTATGNIPSG